ncbi:MAG: ester cyclase [Solirubrobacterales bacterium]|nr:ester cyclase [Solirubrobacterales bacterium]
MSPPAKALDPKPPTPAKVAAAYFAALAARDVEAMVACWAPGGRELIRGQVDTTAPDGVRAYFTALFAAFPDLEFRVVATTVQKERAVVRWELSGTFAGAPFGGIEPTGARLELEGMDELTITDGLIQENNAFTDGMTFARQIGMLPAEGSPADQRVLKAFNAKSRLASRLQASGAEHVADGVWRVRGGMPKKTMNVYLVRDGDGVLAFDAGIRQMGRGIATAAAQLGGLTRIVLGHAHADHRGAAAELAVPTFCHADDQADAEGDGGAHYFDLSKLRFYGRAAFGRLLPFWDGGPVPITGTLAEGDDVAGFSVVHLPGHAPGLIALWRGEDRLALTSDCFYTVDPQTTIYGPPRVPLAAFNQDTEQARASIRKLAGYAPAAAWPGHAEPLTGDVAAALEQAAATT